MARPVVPDLAAPDPIRPAGLQSDTFAAPAQPAVNRNLEMLAEGLGAFNRGLMQYYDKWSVEDKKQRIAAGEAAVDDWRTRRTEAEQLEDIRAGKAPLMSDKYIGPVLKTYRGQLEARALGRMIDEKFERGEIPYGKESFNVERWLLDEANPIAEKLRGDPHMIGGFRKGLDALRSGMVERHEKARAIAIDRETKQVLYDEVKAAITSGTINGNDPDAITSTFRQVIKAVGPRMQGGSLGIRLAEGEEVALKVLDELAGDVAYAEVIPKILAAPRGDLLNTGVNLPAFKDDVRFKAAADAINRKVVETRFKAEKQGVEANYRNSVMNALVSGGFGEFDKLVKDGVMVPSAAKPGEMIEVSGEKVGKMARQAYVQWMRAQTPDNKPDWRREIEAFSAKGLIHEEAVAKLNAAQVAGMTLLNMPGRAPDDQAVNQLREGVLIYQAMQQVAPGMIPQLSDKQQEFFQSYSVFTDQLGLDDRAALNMMQTIYSNEALKKDPRADAGRRSEQLERGVANLRAQGFFGLDLRIPGWSNTPENQGALIMAARPLADKLMQTGMFTGQQAVERAVKAIQDNAIMVNGQMLFGVRDLNRDHVPVIEDRIKKVYEAHKAELSTFGVTSEKDLTIVPLGQSGRMVIWSRKTQTPVTIVNPGRLYDASRPDEAVSDPTPLGVLEFSIRDVQRDAHDRAIARSEQAVKDGIVNGDRANKVLEALFSGNPYPYKTDGSQKWQPNQTPPKSLMEAIDGDLGISERLGRYGSALSEASKEGRKVYEGVANQRMDTIRRARRDLGDRLNNRGAYERKK